MSVNLISNDTKFIRNMYKILFNVLALSGICYIPLFVYFSELIIYLESRVMQLKKSDRLQCPGDDDGDEVF